MARGAINLLLLSLSPSERRVLLTALAALALRDAGTRRSCDALAERLLGGAAYRDARIRMARAQRAGPGDA